MIRTDGEREEIIRLAVAKAKDKNLKLSICSWGVEWSKTKDQWVPQKNQKCCALSCVILEYQDTLPRKLDWRAWTIESILGCDSDWISSFIRGFDGYPKTVYDGPTFAYDLGFLLSDELVRNTQLKMS